AQGRPNEDPVCQDAQGGTLGGLKELPAGLKEKELHAQARGGLDLTYMMTNVPGNASTSVQLETRLPAAGPVIPITLSGRSGRVALPPFSSAAHNPE
ncbi:MAG TPA: hypothetical protein VK899_00430, partial [Gemmatimonadales bacterium]|nr:hypothetical protein [Gemmatimonadales bacterium]